MQNPSNEQCMQLKQVSRYFGDVAAVQDLTLDIPKRQIIGLLGLNGAGKSTCLQMLAGTLAPSLGNIIIEGDDIQSSAILAKSKIGYLPEQPPLYSNQTVDEYLDFIGRLYGVDIEKRKQRIVICKEQCGLKEVGNRRIGNLSKGYQQRVGIAQAILHEPKIIILDEPTVGLDPQQLQNMRTLVRTLGKHATVIFSSHMLSEVCAVADRILIMHKGQLVHDGMNDDPEHLEQLFSRIIFGKAISDE
jgi:ABC-2 type transport system ATP-binding protein